MKNEPIPFDRAFGDVIARRRRALGATQDDLARAARALGLEWKAATAAQLETERRHWTPVEVFLAPVILQLVGEHIQGDDFEGPTLPDLLRELARVEPGYDGRLLARLATGEADPGEVGQVSLTGTALLRRDPVAYLGSMATGSGRTDAQTIRVWRDLTAKKIRAARSAERGEAERKAARRLDVAPSDVALAAQHLWRRSLTEKRDVLVAEEIRKRGLGAQASRPLRGHVTRKLDEELRAELKRRFPSDDAATSEPLARVLIPRAPARQPRKAKKAGSGKRQTAR